MLIDKTTLYDFSIFDHNEEMSLLHHLNLCKTANGRLWLEHFLKTPLASIKEITDRQQLLQSIINIHSQWPENISNGSVLMIEKFYESQIDNIPSHANAVSSNLYKIVYAQDFELLSNSVSQF